VNELTKKILGTYQLFNIIATNEPKLKRHSIYMSKKQLFTLEFPVRCSPNILFEFLSTASGLQEWFADKVDEWENVFSFSWNGGVPDKAEILDQEADKFIRFKWLHSEKNEYFEFSIEKTEISNQTILIIKDFAEKNEIKDQSRLWEYQIKELFHRVGGN
jgi:uncharacterized protein YndB with AHSA1/START domain